MASVKPPRKSVLKITGAPATDTEVDVTINVRLLDVSADTKVVRVAENYEELVVYENEGGIDGSTDECLYLYGKWTATMPEPGLGKFYIAVDLLNARTNAHLVDVRGLIRTCIHLFLSEGLQHPGGTGPVSSHP